MFIVLSHQSFRVICHVVKITNTVAYLPVRTKYSTLYRIVINTELRVIKYIIWHVAQNYYIVKKQENVTYNQEKN